MLCISFFSFNSPAYTVAALNPAYHSHILLLLQEQKQVSKIYF